MIYITFDDFYNINEYNAILSELKKKIFIIEHIKIKPPFNRFLEINKKSLEYIKYKFKIGTSNDIRYLVPAILPTTPEEEKFLRRKEGEDYPCTKYISPLKLINLNRRKYIILFESDDITELQILSKKISKKIHKLGTIDNDIYYTFSREITQYLDKSRVLLEFGKNAKYGLKHSKKMPNYELLEYYIKLYKNHPIFRKYLKNEYFLNGKRVPLKRYSFI